MTHLPASRIIKAIGAAERVPSAYKRRSSLTGKDFAEGDCCPLS